MKPRFHLQILTILSLFLFTLPVSQVYARYQETSLTTDLNDIKSGSLLFKTEKSGEYLEAPRLESRVDIKVSGMVARVTLYQKFENRSSEWMEGLYAFPLPEDAAVDRLKMKIGMRTIVGEIQEKEQAKRTYQAAKRSGRKASLVEQKRPNLFTNSVANIAPRESIIIEIGYLQTLDYKDGKYNLRFPMTITPRYTPQNPEHRQQEEETGSPVVPKEGEIQTVQQPSIKDTGQINNPIAINATINAGFPLEELNSSFHELVVSKEENYHYVKLKEGIVPMDRDFELSWVPKIGEEPGTALFTEEVDGETYALIMLMPPHEILEKQTLRKEMIFVIDTSGSMQGVSIIQAKKALLRGLESLSDKDRFNIIRFDTYTDQLFPSAVPVTERNLAAATQYVQSLVADHGTEMGSALTNALKDEAPEGFVRQVIFITDGSISNENHLFGLIKKGLRSSRLFMVGIGSAPNSYFMKKASEFGRGTSTMIGSLEQVEERMSTLFSQLEKPILSNLKLSWDSDPSIEMWPKRHTDLYAGEPMVVTAKLSQLQGKLHVSGNTSSEAWGENFEFGKKKEQNGIATLWARKKIESLMDSVHDGVSSDKVRKDVVAVALRHSLVSKYTSLVAVDKTPSRNPATDPLAQKQIANNAPSQKMARSASYPQTATSAPMNLIISILSLIAAALCFLALRSRKSQ